MISPPTNSSATQERILRETAEVPTAKAFQLATNSWNSGVLIMANSGHSKGAVVAASGRYGNRVFGRRHLFPRCIRSRRMWLPLKRDVPKSPSGAKAALVLSAGTPS